MSAVADLDPLQTATLAADLRVLIGQLRRRLREETESHDLTPSQLSVLSHLEREGPATVTSLARVERVRPQSMGATIAGLEARALVIGTPDPADRRQTILSLTPTCRDWIERHRAARQDWLVRALQAHLAPAEQVDLARAVKLLRRLADS